jgi:hypothetical protein
MAIGTRRRGYGHRKSERVPSNKEAIESRKSQQFTPTTRSKAPLSRLYPDISRFTGPAKSHCPESGIRNTEASRSTTETCHANEADG